MQINADLEGLEETLRAAVTRAVADALVGCEALSPWLNVEQAATYLASTPDAVRSAIKRQQLPAHRTRTGRVLLRRDELDEFATGGD